MDRKCKQLLALCGSLRKQSLNRIALAAVEAMAGEYFQLEWADPAALPLFNPDLETDLPAVVIRLLEQIEAADGLVIASPEYAHGISGVLKNTLDWLVSSPAFYQKPVMLINTSPRAHHALDSTREILTTMSAQVVEEACVTLPLLGNAEILRPDSHMKVLLSPAVEQFLELI
ncbi:NADPH-dependent FMN reductase [Oceanobacter mangrovi]|uniref:NADPH-dependent FMN reductase n=1 Tax=Oceanobacter mangrovi TaxID=2862510 RepID=UPI001C8E8E7A|nr:NADPH-dependent FMN reductase [Oceanobacter mangrovi]